MWSAIYLYYLMSRNEEIAPFSGSGLVKRRTDKITEISRLDYLIRVTNQPLIDKAGLNLSDYLGTK